METLPKDIIISTVMDLDLHEILALCKSRKQMNALICSSNEFWQRKLFKDFKIVSKGDAKNLYSQIIENKQYCSQLIKEPKEFNSEETFLETFLENYFNYFNYRKFLNTGDTLVFNYLTSKILGQDHGIPMFFEKTYDQYIKQYASSYNNRITRGKDFTEDDMTVLKEIMVRFRDSIPKIIVGREKQQFFTAILNRFLAGTIPFNAVDLCKYPIY